MQKINVYVSIGEAELAIDEGRLKRGEYFYMFNDKPKVLKSITLYRVIKNKYTKELDLINY